MAQWHKSLAAVHLACVAARLRRSEFNSRLRRSGFNSRLRKSGTPGSGGLGLTPGSSSLSVHAGQLSAYSEINISGKHRGFDGMLFNL